MKYAGWAMVVLVLVGGGVYFLLEHDSVTTNNVTTEVTKLKETGRDSVQKPLTDDIGPAALHDKNAAQSQRETTKVTEEQRAVAVQREEKILDMAREYEAVRSDPQKRQALRTEMKQQLALYQEAVLPIAMEKMESAQSPN